MKQKIKLGIILGVEFVAITVILILIFFAGKKSYTVTFDVNGGTLISGDLVQTVPQGKNATPPVVAKDGCYLHSWSGSYNRVTNDVHVTAVWEWNTSIGFDYSASDNSDYCIITGCFKDIVGDVYVGVFREGKKVLGIESEVFRDHDGITYIHMLDGILSIGERAFADCDNLVDVELPGTLKKLGERAFENCVSLERVTFPRELEVIPAGAFAGCTSLKEIVIPASVKTVSADAFIGCTSLEKVTFETREITEKDELTGSESVTVDGIHLLEPGVFNGCEALREVTLPETLLNISQGAFRDCTSLEKITIPASVEGLGREAFAGCTSLNTVILQTREVAVFDEATKEPVTDPDTGTIVTELKGLVSIEGGVFTGCEKLFEIVLPATVKNIAEGAFDSTLLTVRLTIDETDKPEGFEDNWHGASDVEWGYVPEPVPEEPAAEEEAEGKKGWLS